MGEEKEKEKVVIVGNRGVAAPKPSNEGVRGRGKEGSGWGGSLFFRENFSV